VLLNGGERNAMKLISAFCTANRKLSLGPQQSSVGNAQLNSFGACNTVEPEESLLDGKTEDKMMWNFANRLDPDCSIPVGRHRDKCPRDGLIT